MKRCAASLAIVLLVSGCAATGPTYTEHLASRAVPPASAWLVLFRTKDSMQYSGRASAIKLDANSLGSCEYGGFSAFDVAPGKHVLTVDMWDSPGTCDLQIEVTAGNRYFFQIRPRSANLTGALVGGLIGMAVESYGLQCGGAFSVHLVPEEYATAKLADLRMTEASTLPPAGALQPVSTPAVQSGTSESVEQRLTELKRLRDAGLITEDVYQDQQRRALGLR